MNKTSIKNFTTSCLMIVVLLQQSVNFVYADDGFVGSPTYNDGFVGSPTYNDGFVGSPTYNDGFVGSPTYNDGFVGSPTYNDGFVGSPTYNDGYVGSQVITTTSATPVYNDGYVGSSYSYPTVSGGYTYGSTGYSSPSIQIGYGSTGYNSGYNYGGYTYGGGYTYTNNNTNNVSCPAGSTLINGTCRINTTSCPSGSTLVNGTCQITNTSCPTGSVLVNGTCQINTVNCPSGSTLINGICQINNVNCPSGSTLVNGVCTVTTVNTNYTCPNGTIVAYAALCPIGYTYSNYTYPSVNYTYPNYNQPVVINQPIVRYPTITPIPTVKFNNVVTSVVTQITNTSGRCNGIGLIANGSPSTGWFEYGETASLGRTTASAQIGRNATAPFSNVLANLKPTTRYYCRAVMQNEYGVVKGEIVSFVTKSKVTTYVETVTKTKKTVAKKVVTPIKKPTLVTCSDGSSFYAKNESQATILNQGEKLVRLQIEKSEGNVSPNALVSYKINYRNISDSTLTGVVIKVIIPAEIKLSQATAGVYDEVTQVLTLNQDTLNANAEGIITISGVVKEDAPIGKSIVATAYVVYTVPGTSVQDEVTAYVVSSITPMSKISNVDTGAKKVIGGGSERGFMPNNLVEWLALIAIIFIIFILGRSIYISYKENETAVH